MKTMPYFVMAGLLLLSLRTAIVGGGSYWIVPALIWPMIGIYAVLDRRLKAREHRGERLAADRNA